MNVESLKALSILQNIEQENETDFRFTVYIEADKTFKSKLIGGSIVLGGLWTILLKFWDKIF